MSKVAKGTSRRLLNDWDEMPGGTLASQWTAPGGTTFTYLRTVDHFDWFKAVVAFDSDLTTRDGRTIPAGTEVRVGWGITDEKFSTDV